MHGKQTDLMQKANVKLISIVAKAAALVVAIMLLMVVSTKLSVGEKLHSSFDFLNPFAPDAFITNYW